VTFSEKQPEAGQDILVLDADASVRKGAIRMLQESGFSVTALADLERAKDQISNRFFPVVLADLDTPTPDAALTLLAFVRERSPLSSVIVLTRRMSYEILTKLFRAGAKDVVPKTSAHARHLRQSVLQAAASVHSTTLREQLLAELVDLNEELLRKLMELSRQVTDQKDVILSHDGDSSSAVKDLSVFNVLVADDEDDLAEALKRELLEEKGWNIRHVHSGGEALDNATQIHPRVLIAKEILPDLPGRMVVKTVKSSLPQMVAMLFSPPSHEKPGEIKVAEDSRLHVLVPKFLVPADLIVEMEKAREGIVRKAKDRRYLKIFQNQYLEILQQCQRLKQRVDSREGTGT
jgi:DNA-binding NtrC family response regulator